MIFYYSDDFKKDIKEIPKEIQDMFFKKAEFMKSNIHHPSLRTKKMKAHDDIYEGSVNMQYRFTFQYYKDGILLRNIGNHDDVLNNP